MSTATPTTHRGQGPITFGVYDTINGKAAHGYLISQRKVTCHASVLKLTPEVEKKAIGESCTGMGHTTDRKARKQQFMVELTLHKFSRLEFAMAYYGVSADVVAGTVTGEPLATMAAGDVFHTKHPGISSVAIKDSAGSPATLVLGTHYTLEGAAHGQGTITNLGTFVQPFKLDYSYASYSKIAPLSQSSIRRGLIFDGINTDNANASERIWVPDIDWDPSDYNWLSDDDEPLVLKGQAMYLSALATDPDWGPYAKIDALPST